MIKCESLLEDTINIACHAGNCFLKKTTYELLIGRSQIFHTLGSLVTHATLPEKMNKLERKCDEEFLVGYSSSS